MHTFSVADMTHKCTQERPSCQKCLRSNRVCEGYNKYPVFIIRTAEGMVKRKALEEIKPVRGNAQATVIKNIWDESSTALHLVSNQQAIRGGVDLAPLFLNRAQTILLENWLPLTIAKNDGCAEWLVTVVSRPTRSPALNASLKALSLTRLGRNLGDSALVQLGKNAYGVALKEVQKALWDPKAMWYDDTLAAGRLCSTYEVCDDIFL